MKTTGLLAALLALAACGGGGVDDGQAAGSTATIAAAAGKAEVAASSGGEVAATGGVDLAATGGVDLAATGGAGAAATTDPDAIDTSEGADMRQRALSIWREARVQRRPKGSCAGCHGPDFFDLARIGTTRENTIRRAVIDGATSAEAELLARAISLLRRQYAMPATDPTKFRPFQPGGAMLPGATSQQRDIAFGHQLETLLPTLMGGRIATLAQARRARDEMIDIARGSNLAGANPQRTSIRTLPVGLPFAQWSADAFNAQGSDLAQTTLNDWISDIALEPADTDRAQWLALQQAYLDDPSNPNFWRMYAFVDRLLPMPAVHMASLTDVQRDKVTRWAAQKYRSALIGQQLLRTEALGTKDQFMGPGAVAFAYLLQNNHGVDLSSKWSVLPQSRLWDVADVGGRQVLQSSISTPANAPLPQALAELGFPQFVQDSVKSAATGASMNRWDTGFEMRASWFWLGLTLDPSLYRLGRSGSTIGGEYINQTLASEVFKLFIHDQFSQVLRAVARTLPETGFDQPFRLGYVTQATEFFMGNYLIQFHPSGGIVRNDWVTLEQKALYTRLVNNSHRMYLLLYADVLRRGAGKKISQIDFDNFTGRMRTVFGAYEPATQAADEALIQDVKTLGAY